MARSSTTLRPNRGNGEGDALTVLFDPSDPQERRAQAAAKRLAVKYGRRKQVMVALLEIIYQVHEQTGELLTPMAIASALERGLSAPAQLSSYSMLTLGHGGHRTSANSENGLMEPLLQLQHTPQPRSTAIKIVHNARAASSADVASTFTSRAI